MTADFIALFGIVLIGLVSPLIADAIPRKPIPAVVFQVVLGAIFGTYLLGFIEPTNAIAVISQLGMAFLFLLAGYEIDPKALVLEERGKAAIITWVASFGIALAAAFFIPLYAGTDATTKIAIAIALSSTAIGTLMPILAERGLLDTSVGKTVVAHGSLAEIGPIIAMALLLSTRSTWLSLMILTSFFVLAGLAVVIPAKIERLGDKIQRIFNSTPNPSAQMAVRIAVFLMVGLVTLASFFELDIVLGAFAAGFVLRAFAGEENEILQPRLDAVGYGFFIPLFFVVSGTGINLPALLHEPALLFGTVAVILLVRALPVFAATFFPQEDRLEMTWRDRLTASLYSATSITIIVAVAHVAKASGAMDETTASVLIAAGAITVIIMPVLTSVTSNIAEYHPIQGMKEIAMDPQHVLDILREHNEMRLRTNERYREMRIEAVRRRRRASVAKKADAYFEKNTDRYRDEFESDRPVRHVLPVLDLTNERHRAIAFKRAGYPNYLELAARKVKVDPEVKETLVRKAFEDQSEDTLQNFKDEQRDDQAPNNVAQKIAQALSDQGAIEADRNYRQDH